MKRWLLTLQFMKQPSKKLELLCVFHSLMTLMCCAMEELALYIVQESRCGKCKFVCKALRSCSLVIHYKNGATVDGGRKERMNEQSARVSCFLPSSLHCCVVVIMDYRLAGHTHCSLVRDLVFLSASPPLRLH